jgi:hypothetical protein
MREVALSFSHGFPSVRSLSLCAVLVVVAQAIVGCGRGCTLLGCSDMVRYAIPDAVFAAWDAEGLTPVAVETCVGDLCQVTEVTLTANGTPRQTPEFILDPGSLNTGDAYITRLTVTASDGQILFTQSDVDVALEEWTPNGPGCEPTCATAVIGVEPTDLGP